MVSYEAVNYVTAKFVGETRHTGSFFMALTYFLEALGVSLLG